MNTKTLTVAEVQALGGRESARKALGYRPVPTVLELAAQGLAREVVGARPHGAKGRQEPTAWVLKPEGQALIDQALSHNALLPGLPPDYLAEDQPPVQTRRKRGA